MSTRTSAQLAALLAAAAVAAGCGGSSQQSTTAGAASHTQSQAQTTVSGQATTNVAHARGQRHSGADSAVASRPATVSGTPIPSAGRRAAAKAATPQPSAIPAGPLVSGFSGTGNQAIGSISEKKNVVIEWKAASPPMQIFNAHGVLLLNSDLPSGRVRLASGDYRNLQVGSKGPWRIQIHASG